MEKDVDMEFMNIQMVIFMKVNGKVIKKKV